MSDQYEKHIAGFITDKPLELQFDPDTGLVQVIFAVEFGNDVVGWAERKMSLFLTQKASLALLGDLPKLEAVLLKAKQGKTKPDFLQ